MYSEYSESEDEHDDTPLLSPYDIWKHQTSLLDELVEHFREYNGLEWCKLFYMDDILYEACIAKSMSTEDLADRIQQVVSTEEWTDLCWIEDLFLEQHELQNLFKLCYHAAEIMNVHTSEHNILSIMYHTLLKRRKVYFFEPHDNCGASSNWLTARKILKYDSM